MLTKSELEVIDRVATLTAEANIALINAQAAATAIIEHRDGIGNGVLDHIKRRLAQLDVAREALR